MAVLILTLGAWVRGWPGAGMRVEVSSARRELAEAVGAVRPSEGRLTGGFAYARFAPKGDILLRGSRKLNEVRGRIKKSLRLEGSPQAFADAGVLHLLDRQLEKAVAFLEQASRRGSADAGIWSDLAAAYLARAERDGRFADLLDALAAAVQAVKADPKHPEAQFNFALTLNQLSLRSRSRAAWARYFDLDGESEWHREAEERFTALFTPGHAGRWADSRSAFEQATHVEIDVEARKLVKLFPQQARELVEEDLLGRWAVQRSQAHITEAKRSLALAKAIGAALAVARGESMVADAVQAVQVTQTDSLGPLVWGHAQYQEGLRQQHRGDFDSSARQFAIAEEALGAARSPFALWARFRLAICEYQTFNYDSSVRGLEEILRASGIERYSALAARSHWVLGLIHGIRGEPAEALAAYKRSWELFDRLGERGNQALVSNLLAEVHRNLGDFPGAWKFHASALKGLPFLAATSRRQPIVEEVGVSLVANDRPQLAMYFYEEVLRSGMSSVGSLGLAGTLSRLAEAQRRKGNPEKAVASLIRAEDAVLAVPPSPLREALRGDLLAQKGRIGAGLPADRVIDLLTEAIESYERTEYRQQVIQLYLQRARALRYKSQPEFAEADLRRAIELVGAYRFPQGFSAASFEDVRKVFDEMVLLQIGRRRPQQALQYVEMGRSLLLALMVPGTGGEAVDLPEIQESLPPGVAILESWLGEKEIFLWCLRRDRLDFAAVPVDRYRFSRAVMAFRKAVAKDDLAAAGPLAVWLHAALIQPLEGSLQDTETLVLAPDWQLAGLPFAALQGAAGRYLIEDHALAIVPGMSVYVRCRRRGEELAGKPLGVLAFGNPTVNRSVFPTLSDLPRSEAEAIRVAEVYPRSKVVLGASATRRRMLVEMDRWSVIHFGGHAVSNPANPFLSALVLTPEGSDTGVFYVRDLAISRLSHIRLIVLAACSTLVGTSSDSVPIIAAPLLARGVPAVVGTLWPVGDEEAEGLVLDLHQRFVERGELAQALRLSQLSNLRGSDPRRRSPSQWAGFTVVGF